MRFPGTASIILFLCLASTNVLAQTEVDERAVISYDKGLGFFSPDSVFGLNLRFRMQNRIGMTTFSSGNLSPREFEANVRRLRLRFDGFIGRTGLTYYLQLSFSRSDQDWDASGFPGIVRDAMIFYNFSENFYIGLGQGKLPGNRQRVISSGQQQFADRSIVNAVFNIDRDFGLMAYYTNHIGGMHYNLKGAITTGEGRNIQRTDDGLSYTARAEVLPLGLFKKDGDFSEGDLARENTPKISLGITFSSNKNAVRVAGQRGQTLQNPTDIENIFADMIAKYNGWALQAEYARRSGENTGLPAVLTSNAGDPDAIYIYNGQGINIQMSYVFPSLFELAGRYSRLQPAYDIESYEPVTSIASMGITRYLPNHRNKIQLNISHQQMIFYNASNQSNWNIMLQVELGI